MPITTRLALALVACFITQVSLAHADTCVERSTDQATRSPEEIATGKQLFTKGRKLQADGRDGEACKMFESSLLLDPQIGTRLNVAACREKAGDLVAARLAYEEAATEANSADDPRGEFASERQTALAAQLVKVTVNVAEPNTAGISMRIGGCPIPKVEATETRYVMPGELVVDVSAPGRKSFHKSQPATAGKVLVIDVPLLGSDTVDPQAIERAKRAEALADAERRRAEEATAKLYGTHPARKWAIIGGSVGAATMIAGGAFGVLARGAQSDFNAAECGQRDHLLDPAGYASCQDLMDKGQRNALFANAFLIGGGVVLAASAVVFVIDPGYRQRPSRAALMVSPRSVGVALAW